MAESSAHMLPWVASGFTLESEAGAVDGRSLRRTCRALRDRLEALGIRRRDCLAVAGSDNFDNAVAVLALLACNQDFYLATGSSGVEVPSFCEGRLLTVPRPPFLESPGPRPGPDPLRRGPESRGAGGARIYLRSSGSTGNAKLIVFTHKKLLANARNCVERFNLTADDRIAITVPVSHMFGLGAALIPAALSGSVVDVQTGSNVLRFVGREKRFGPTVAFMTPPFASGLVKGRRGSRAYRLTVTAGDRFNPERFDAYESRFGPVVQLYGSTEMGAVAATAIDDPPEVRKFTVGRPMKGVEVRTPGSEGTLQCRHPCGFEGYAIDEDPKPEPSGVLFDTRDAVEIDANGNITVLGRRDGAANRDGYLLFLGEIESAVARVEEVEQVVVVSPGSTERGAFIVAICVIADGRCLTEEELRSKCALQMPRHLLPDRMEIRDSIPLTPNGKPDRQRIAFMTELPSPESP